MKKCKDCGLLKPLTEFHKHPISPDGVRYECKPCRRLANAANRVARSAYSRLLYEKNRERIKRNARLWKANNKQRHRAYSRNWVLNNKDRATSSKRTYYKKNSAIILAHIKEWKKRNPEALRDYFHRRKAALKKVGGSHTRAQIAALAAAQGYLCMACRCDISKRWDRDHIVPISKGGSNDISNIQLLCPPCNYEKRAKDWTVFLEQRAG